MDALEQLPVMDLQVISLLYLTKCKQTSPRNTEVRHMVGISECNWASPNTIAFKKISNTIGHLLRATIDGCHYILKCYPNLFLSIACVVVASTAIMERNL